MRKGTKVRVRGHGVGRTRVRVCDPTGKMGDRRTTDTPQISFSEAGAAVNGAGVSEAQPMPMSRNEDLFHIKEFYGIL